MKEKNVKIIIAVTCVVLLLTVFVFSQYNQSTTLKQQKETPTKKITKNNNKTDEHQQPDQKEEYTNVSYRQNKETTNKQNNQSTTKEQANPASEKTSKLNEKNHSKGETNTTKPTSKPDSSNQQKPNETKPKPDPTPDKNDNTAYDKAVALVEKAEQSRLKADYLEAKDAINDVTDNEQAEQLLDRLNQIDLKKDYQSFLSDSKKMYEQATTLLKQYQKLSADEKKDWITKPDNTNFRKKLYTTKYNNVLPTYPNELLWEEHQHKTLRIQAFFDQPQTKDANVIVYGSSLDNGWLTYYIYQPEENTWYRGPGVHLTTGYKNVITQLKNDPRWIKLDLNN